MSWYHNKQKKELTLVKWPLENACAYTEDVSNNLQEIHNNFTGGEMSM